jgi:1-acyl-sn-glycerol-3-phosphate acyltransferase
VFYWLLKRIILGPVLLTTFRPWVRGEENVPETGGAILASNHLSFSDSIFLPLVIKRRVTFLAKSDYFTGRGIKGRLTAFFLRGVGQLPVDRSGGEASDAALRTGLRVLRRGDVLGIYPEGTRSPDGRLYRGKTGVARLALEARVPVLPVAMIGTDKVQPVGRRLPRLGRVGIVIGAPLDFSRYEGMEDDRFVLRSITDEIMYELMELSGQEYVDVYAATMKERIAAARRSARSSTKAGSERRVALVAEPAGSSAGPPIAGASDPSTSGASDHPTSEAGDHATDAGDQAKRATDDEDPADGAAGSPPPAA